MPPAVETDSLGHILSQKPMMEPGDSTMKAADSVSVNAEAGADFPVGPRDQR